MNEPPPPPDQLRDPDPAIRLLRNCRECHGPMGPLRVNEGTSHLSSRGKLCQKCRFCHWSFSHTPAYEYNDALNLVTRINARQLGQAIPLDALHAPLRFAPQRTDVNGPGNCEEPGCHTTTGKPRQANAKCIEHKCKTCCAEAFNAAQAANTYRDSSTTRFNKTYIEVDVVYRPGSGPAGQPGHTRGRTGTGSDPYPMGVRVPRVRVRVAVFRPGPGPVPNTTHHLGGVAGPAYQAPPSLPPSPPPHSQVPPAPFQPRLPVAGPAHQDSLSIVQQPAVQSQILHPYPQALPSNSFNTYAPLPLPPNPDSQAPPSSQPRSTAGLSHAPRKHQLAQPMSATWVNKRSEENRAVQSNKTARQRLDVAQQSTVEFVVYYREHQSPLRIQLPIPTFPQTCLADHADLMSELKLGSSSWLDVYQGGDWKTLQTSTVIEVSKHHPVVIRLRPSLLEEIPLERCPNYNDFLIQQPRKRTGSALVSPPKKVARMSTDSAPIAAHRTPLLLPPVPPPIAGQTSSSVEPPAIIYQPPPSLAPLPLPVSTVAESVNNSSVRHFPESFTVAEHDRAWVRYDEQQKIRTLGREKMWHELFPNSRFAKTTVGFWHKFYVGAPRAIRDHFIGLGAAGSWTEFRTAVSAYQKDGILPQFLLAASHYPPAAPPVAPPPISVQPLATLNDAEPSAAVTSHAEQPQSQSTPLTSTYGLCDFCDTPYKVEPSAKLLQLRSQLFLISSLSPNVFNPAHRTLLSQSRLAVYCKQHETDAVLMPAARAGGWPEYINFASMLSRVDDLVPELQVILEDLPSSVFFEDACSTKHFLKKTGYFGPIGYNAVKQFVVDKFPVVTIQDNIAPLTYNELVELFVAEALIYLITEDLAVDSDTAMTVLEDSTSYGHAYHADVDDRDRSAAKFRADPVEPAREHQRLPIPFPLASPIPSPTLPVPLTLPPREDTPSPPPADPETLCHYCDEPLPLSPTETLVDMGDKLYCISWAAPHPSNRLHRKLPRITRSADYCQRHRFERDQLGPALSRGWPDKPNFGQQPGTRAWNGIIIATALSLLFPPDSPDSDLVPAYHPLPHIIFLREVLIPETTIRLIESDCRVNREEATSILHESYQFGLTLHPNDGECQSYTRILMCIADSNRYPNCSFDQYRISGTELSFEQWVMQQRGMDVVKNEPVDISLDHARGSPHIREVIDLTGDDDN
ncbi:hypothetical protein GGX14DRAFT_393200 [Mycena pura]|uniref:Restriction of telomere capping protein 4 n=1 Tax=Mycena pura TaxID=153505 RepID=A0AAD6VJ10_9AGAR|nr:hypothetical protein GGX14DRAFT_393200 [Mycena pura]